MAKKEMLVAAIQNGTVIDHIPSEKTYQVATLLKLNEMTTPVTIGYNLRSKKLGRKGIIKIENKFFTDEEISRLSVVAPNIVLNVIKDFEVVEKKTVITPKDIRGIVRCNNPKCVTNNEPMQTHFHVDNGILTCHYCEMEQDINKVELV
jgi:aspartate carbamoyltransferase regulatory subunit